MTAAQRMERLLADLAAAVAAVERENAELRRRVAVLEAQLADALDGYHHMKSERDVLREVNDELRKLKEGR